MESLCSCIHQAAYALGCANIPATIFTKYICSNHGPLRQTDQTPYIQCILQPDVLLTESENVAAWKTSYHGASVETILSILVHGELLMEGDVMNDGNTLTARHSRPEDAKGAIWTYPTIEGADNRTIVGSYDNGETSVKMLLQLRQRPESYKTALTRWGFEIWSTNRRGTIYIESLYVCVLKSKGSWKPLISKAIPPSLDVSTFSCPVLQKAYKYLKTLNIPKSMLTSRGNRCFCETCYPDSRPKYEEFAGDRYIIPCGWARFGLAVNPVFAASNDTWESWNIAYHGCNPSNLISILKHRTLLIPHDYLCDGTELRVSSSKDQNQKYYFLSPSMDYAAHPWYAKYQEFEDDSVGQVAIVFKIKPGAQKKQRETEGGAMKLFDNYNVIAEDEIEWFSSRRGCLHPYGILVRTLTQSQLRDRHMKYNIPLNILPAAS